MQQMTGSPQEDSLSINTTVKVEDGTLELLRPRFIHELVVVPSRNGTIIEGGKQFQVLEGEGTKQLLSHLLRLSDGTRTAKELNEAITGVPREEVTEALHFLNEAGLLEEGTELDWLDAPVNGETLSFFRRYAPMTRINRNGRQALQRLESRRVIIVTGQSGTETGNTLRELLIKTGVSQVNVVATLAADLISKPVSDVPPIAVSLCLGPENRDQHADVADICWEYKTPWLRVVVDTINSYADLGPLFMNGKNPCYRCFHQIHGIATQRSPQSSPALPQVDMRFWISLVAAEIIYLLSCISPSDLGRAIRRYDIFGTHFQKLRWPRIPGCHKCLPNSEINESMDGCEKLIPHAVVFEQYLGLPALEFSVPRLRENGASSSDWERLKYQTKQLGNCVELKLSRKLPKLDRSVLDVLTSTAETQREAVTVDELAALLLLTGGFRNVRNAKLQRWAPTAGNLGSVELFVVAREIDNLEKGVYFYQPHEHSLARFRRRGGRVAVDELMRRICGVEPAQLPDALIIFTAAFHRVSKKYGAFGYRLINMDAGAAINQFQMTANTLGISSRVVARWPDDLIASQLNLDPPDEQVTAVVMIQAKPNWTAESGYQSHLSSPAKPISHFCALSVHNVFQELYADSRIHEGQLSRSTVRGMEQSQRQQDELSSFISLPASLSGGRFVGDILPRRTTARRYSQHPVSAEQLSSMLYCAQQKDVGDWPLESMNNNSLEFIVLAWRVNGLDPAAYSYDAASNGLKYIRELPSSSDASRLFIQGKFGSAPVVIWIAGNLASASGVYGAFGHRQLLLRAGAAAHRMWMAAMAMGLSGAIVAGLVPGEAYRRFGFDGYRRASLVACTTGTAFNFYARQAAPEQGSEHEQRTSE